MKARSQHLKAAPTAPTVFRSRYATVRVYTRRHINGCLFRSPDQQHCPCPKWIYLNAKGQKPKRLAAGTPSFTEASAEAQKLLRGCDPEIRAAREIVQPRLGIPIGEAVELYLAMLGRRDLAPRYLKSIVALLRAKDFSLRGRRRPRPRNPSLVDFLAGYNLAAQTPIVYAAQLSTTIVDRWATTWQANDLTAANLRNRAASFFKWLVRNGHLERSPFFTEVRKVRVGNRCGYFTDQQMERILSVVPFYIPNNRKPADNYAVRMRAFIELGRWGGMAIADIVRFSPGKNLNAENVLTYRRQKTRAVAKVLLPAELAERLRHIPAEAGSSPEEPFRFAGVDDESTRVRWHNRFQRICREAGILEIETELGRRRPPHAHMLRDTFAIDAISRGVDLANVAKMLGHATVEMTQKSYLFWIEKRVDYCIEDQRRALARTQLPTAAAAEITLGPNVTVH